MDNRGTFQKLRPLSLLEHLSSCYDSAHLQVSSSSVSWSIYLEQGKIIYASHSVDPFDRLDRHLRRLGNQIPTLDSETRAQLRQMFETDPESQSIQHYNYQAICWLVNHQYLKPVQASALIEGLVKEVIESFLLVEGGNYQLENKLDVKPEFCRLNLQPILEHCQNRLQGWQSLGPQILSPYQRPYFLSRHRPQQQLSPEIQQELSAILKGFSFYHLSVLLNKDELQLAQKLHPYIVDGTVVLHDPHPPFDQLPKTFNKLSEIPDQTPENFSTKTQRRPVQSVAPISKTVQENTATSVAHLKRTYTIVCVDDSPTMLKEISYFLDDESFSVFPISDPVKALMQIIRLKPDLILLDVRMASIDGYELCRLVRNHPRFQKTPIIMVTGNTGIIDRVKARLVGASGYLTKPFNQADLLKMVFKHLG
jgi:twitching motility two-component system response regulator PilG